jgi:hypothetical protein
MAKLNQTKAELVAEIQRTIEQQLLPQTNQLNTTAARLMQQTSNSNVTPSPTLSSKS